MRTTTIIALEQCLITSIRKDTMLLTLDSEPGFSAFFIARLVSRINRIEDDLIDQLINRSERRLARPLLLLADFGQEENGKPITVTVNQATLAEMVGTTRSHVNAFMNKFRKKGFHQLRQLPQRDKGPPFTVRRGAARHASAKGR